MKESPPYLQSLPQDFSAGIVIFLVALPLCLGIALASGAPLISGLVAGIVGGTLVAWLSGSHTSVSGPAAGLTAIVLAQIEALGTFDAFLLAVILAGVLQVGMGLLKAGSLAAFFPSSVIKGLLSAIGLILILKQIPHLFGHDPDWLGDMSFQQMDGENTFTGILGILFDVHYGATLIGLSSMALLIGWDNSPLKKLFVPGPLVVVLWGVLLTYLLGDAAVGWTVGGVHLVQVPVSESVAGFFTGLQTPDFSAISQPAIAVAAVTIAIVASLETLLNVEAVDKLDTQKRVTPSNRELVAQGVGNITCGLVGGLPITSVIVRSSVGISSGSRTRMACFIHGILLFFMVLLFPHWLNSIPLACLAAILMVTGFKLAKPSLFQQMWQEGRNQFLPFLATIAAIVLTDLLIGIIVGMVVAMVFILQANLRRPLMQNLEQRSGGDVIRIELADQVTFLNRAALMETIHSIPHGSHVVIDARNSIYIDPDILDLIQEFEEEIAPAHQIELGFLGFADHADVEDRVTYDEATTREIQARTSPEQVLEMLVAGNERFAEGRPHFRDVRRQVQATARSQHPLAIVLSCMDSRVATETIFDVGLGDLFSLRVAGNIVAEEALGSMEFGCLKSGAKLVMVLGHTQCGAVVSTVHLVGAGGASSATIESDHLDAITGPIADAVHGETQTTENRTGSNKEFVRRVTELNVQRAMRAVREGSSTMRELIDSGQVMVVGGVYDVSTGRVELLKGNG